MSSVFVSAIPAMYQLGLLRTPPEDFPKLVALAVVCGYFGLFAITPCEFRFLLSSFFSPRGFQYESSITLGRICYSNPEPAKSSVNANPEASAQVLHTPSRKRPQSGLPNVYGNGDYHPGHAFGC